MAHVTGRPCIRSPIDTAMKIIKTRHGKEIKVDDADFEWLSRQRWCMSNGYAVTYMRHRTKYEPMHRLILGLVGASSALVADHINGDILDNRRANLRVCTRAQNALNASTRKDNALGLRGVRLIKRYGTYEARISRGNGVVKSLGRYPTREEACEVYQLWAEMLHKEFAAHVCRT